MSFGQTAFGLKTGRQTMMGDALKSDVDVKKVASHCSIVLHHPLGGITNPKYKLLCFEQLKSFKKETRH
jgi:hypothetical protein